MFNRIAMIFLSLTSVAMLYQGSTIVYFTTGVVSSTEFQALITLVNQLAYFMVWLASLAVFLISKQFSKPALAKQPATNTVQERRPEPPVQTRLQAQL